MKGQLSIEFLIIIAIINSSFLIISPQLIKLKQVGDYALNVNNAQQILNEVYFACERFKITNEPQELKLTAFQDYELKTNNTHMEIIFEKIVSKELNFECELNLELEKGENKIILGAS